MKNYLLPNCEVILGLSIIIKFDNLEVFKIHFCAWFSDDN